MRYVDKTSTVLKQTKKKVITQINKYVRLIPTSD
nr:23S rRNA methyltransferase attenuation leader peptide [Escherichia coli]UPG22960.1 23S rRNA methyltransferase attenuation leader peptide [Escherichia coli]UPG30170.1 23S rRNA methyltransferase attenuation leader peptide [Escherichia coli]